MHGCKELVQLIVDVFPDMAHDPEKRPLLLQIMKDADADNNGRLDFSEFLQLMRTVEDLGDLTQLQKEPRPLQLGEWRPVLGT
ncbi:Calmodulin [Durusdinium trenchii]|uniref:Calmodulin n=1 Tax=Durusdinium trenchii TaxID=1381693 RepID=A0ABP0PB05_9DINO